MAFPMKKSLVGVLPEATSPSLEYLQVTTVVQESEYRSFLLGALTPSKRQPLAEREMLKLLPNRGGPAFRPRTPSEFLKHNPRLLTFVATVEQKLRETFGASAPVRKVLVRDDDEEYPTLFLIVGVHLTSEEAMAKMGELDETWWLDHAESGEGRVQIDFEHLAERV